jgi:dTDP-4-dehydrorhamnose reductase
MPRLLLVGAGGQLGLELQRARMPAGWSLVCATRPEIDLAQPSDVRRTVEDLLPHVIINAAAYTAVDRAESEPELAFAVNRDGAGEIAKAAAALGAPLVHISTDYVFAGDKREPYVETDSKTPLSVYGRSKAEGEDAVLAAHNRAAIVRTSWLYSPHRANFVNTMLKLTETNDEVRVVADQIGRPTAAADLAAVCVELAAKLLNKDTDAAGMLHYCGAGDATWADFAESIFAEAQEYGGRRVRVHRISTAEYPTPAQRPANSRLDTTRIQSRHGLLPRPWREALRGCIAELSRSKG